MSDMLKLVKGTKTIESGMVDRAHMSLRCSETDYQLWYSL